MVLWALLVRENENCGIRNTTTADPQTLSILIIYSLDFHPLPRLSLHPMGSGGGRLGAGGTSRLDSRRNPEGVSVLGMSQEGGVSYTEMGDERRQNRGVFLGGRVRMEERCYRA